MENNSLNVQGNVADFNADSVSLSRTYMANVFKWMFFALALSSVFAYLFASDETLMGYLLNPAGRGLSGLGYVVMFAPLGFVLLMSFGFNKLSYSVLMLLFLVYAAITGVSLSFILLAYTASSVATCFISAAGMFGLMAVMGYTTKQDLTKFGSLMRMGLVGIIIASLVNFFFKSDTMGYIISIIGVIVFTGLTAYDVQKLKRIGSGMEFGLESTNKMVLMGALTLYLDFINLFLMLLRLFGRRK